MVIEVDSTRRHSSDPATRQPRRVRGRALALSFAVAAAALAAARPVAAQVIVNGSMTGSADVTAFNGVTPPGWTGTTMGTDLWAPTTTAAGTAWATSADGGTFVHGAGVPTGVEWVQQTVTGLSVGTVYKIDFEQAVSDSVFTSRDVAGFWRVQFGTDTLDSAVMTVPAFGVALPWQPQSLTFVASASSQLLRFTARNVTPAPPSKRTECGLDGVKITAGCSPAVLGTEFVRLGTPPNPDALQLSLTGPPVVGEIWDPFIDHGTFVPDSTLDIYLFSEFPANVPSGPMGTVLGTPAFHWEFRLPPDTLHITIPSTCALVERRITVWAGSLDTGGDWHLTNALDISIGSF